MAAYGGAMAQSWLVTAALWSAVELVIQAAWCRATRFQPVGDEFEYLQRAGARDPFRGAMFFRVPMLPSLAWIAGRWRNPTPPLRAFSVISSAVTMGCTAAVLQLIGPSWAVHALMAMFALQPERLVLGSRIWPDVHLAAWGMWLALFLTIGIQQGTTFELALAIGIAGAGAALTRLDGLVMTAAAAVALWAAPIPPDPSAWAAVIGTPVLAFVGWWCVSRFVLNQPWPDDTWRFNLSLERTERAVAAQRSTYAVDDLVDAVLHAPAEGAGPPRDDRDASMVRPVVGRLRAMLGPDTFVRAKLLPTLDLAQPVRGALDGFLRWAYPVLISAAVFSVVFRPRWETLAVLPGLSIIAAGVLFHARTRFRLPTIGGLFIVVAAAEPWRFDGVPPFRIIAASAIALALLLVVGRTPTRREVSPS
jgi:hypothetical protein